MLQIYKSHFNVKNSIIISCGLSLIFSLIFFPVYSYRIGVNPNTMFIVNIIPIVILIVGVIKSWNDKDKNLLSSLFYSLLNMLLSTFVVVMTLIVLFLTGILYM